jgi:hypothetical protein
MELTFTIKRVLLFIGCILLFGLLGGFSNPAYLDHDYSPLFTKAWLYCIVLFVAGAGSVSLVDHMVGWNRFSIRWLYVVLGMVLMGSALMRIYVLRSAAEST